MENPVILFDSSGEAQSVRAGREGCSGAPRLKLQREEARGRHLPRTCPSLTEAEAMQVSAGSLGISFNTLQICTKIFHRQRTGGSGAAQQTSTVFLLQRTPPAVSQLFLPSRV